MEKQMKKSARLSRAVLLAVIMAVSSLGNVSIAMADELNMITVAAVQITAESDPYLLSGDFIADQLTNDFEIEILEDIDSRLSVEFSQLVAAVN